MNKYVLPLVVCLYSFLAVSCMAPHPPDPAPASAPHTSEHNRDSLPSGLTVLELFTSQGCSSCPPADALLAELATNLDLITLTYHVDYWDYLGWKDPYSSPYNSARQHDYTEQLQSRIYTPQVIINGRQEAVGSRSTGVNQLLKAARQGDEVLRVEIFVLPAGDEEISIAYSLKGKTQGLRATALIVQNEAETSVGHGENAGRELRHVNVVRGFSHRAAAATDTISLAWPRGLATVDAKAVLLIQRLPSLEIVAAGQTSF